MASLEETKLSDFILLLLYGIKKEGQFDCITGRTMLQKCVFLLTANTKLRETLGTSYRIHYYGPYSPEVKDASEYLTTFGLIQELPTELPNMTRYDLKLTSEGEDRVHKLLKNLDPESSKKLDVMTKEAAKLNAASLQTVIKKAYEEAGKEGLL